MMKQFSFLNKDMKLSLSDLAAADDEQSEEHSQETQKERTERKKTELEMTKYINGFLSSGAGQSHASMINDFEVLRRRQERERLKEKVKVDRKTQDMKQFLNSAYFSVVVQTEEQLEKQIEQRVIHNQSFKRKSPMRQIRNTKKEEDEDREPSPLRRMREDQKINDTTIEIKRPEQQVNVEYNKQLKYQQLYLQLMQYYQKIKELLYVQKPKQYKNTLYEIIQYNILSKIAVNKLLMQYLTRFCELCQQIVHYARFQEATVQEVDNMQKSLVIGYN